MGRTKISIVCFAIFHLVSWQAVTAGSEVERLLRIGAWKGLVSFGDDGRIRIIEDLGLRYLGSESDTLQLLEGNPGWSGENYRYDDYRWGGDSLVHIKYGYADKPDSTLLSGDHIVHDIEDLRDNLQSVQSTCPIPNQIKIRADSILYCKETDINCDGSKEIIVVYVDQVNENSRTGYPVYWFTVLSVAGEKAEILLEGEFPRHWRVGPTEFRDLDFDGCPETIFHIIGLGGSGWTYSARIYGKPESFGGKIKQGIFINRLNKIRTEKTQNW